MDIFSVVLIRSLFSQRDAFVVIIHVWFTSVAFVFLSISICVTKMTVKSLFDKKIFFANDVLQTDMRLYLIAKYTSTNDFDNI